MSNLAEFENTENPESNQVDNFSDGDGEVDQPVYEGSQTWSCTRKLIKANTIMASLFDIQYNEVCDEISEVLIVDEEPTESLKDLILEFW